MTFKTLKKVIPTNCNIRQAKQDCFLYEYKRDSTLIWNVNNRKQGLRSDLEEVRSAIEGGFTTMKKLREMFPAQVAKYKGFIQDLIADTAPPLDVPEITLKPWQEELLKKLEEPPTKRTVLFYVDAAGGQGKTTFADYIQCKYPDDTQILTPGNANDLAYVIEVNTKILIIDCPRCQASSVPYSLLESVKNRRFVSYKYQPTSKIMRHRPHVLVFMNEYPDISKLTSDRYEIKEI